MRKGQSRQGRYLERFCDFFCFPLVMSDDEILDQAASSRGKPPGDLFEANDLFRDYLKKKKKKKKKKKLKNLKNNISKQTSKLKKKTPSLGLESHRIQLEFNTEESLSPNLKQQDSAMH